MGKIKKALLLLLAIVPPVYINTLFSNRFTIIIILSVIISLVLVYKSTLLQIILTLIILVAIYLYIIIIPFSFYSTWLTQLNESIPSSRITDLIVSVWIISYIYNSLSISISKRYYFFALLFTLIFTLILLNLSSYLFIIPLAIGLYIILNNSSFGFKPLLVITSVIILLLASSYFIAKKSSTNGSTSVNTVSYEVRKFITDKIPSIDILTSIPGNEGLSESKGRPPVLTDSKMFKIWGYPGETYYLRMKIEGDDIFEIDKKDIKKSILRSVKLEVLSDFLPLIPTISGGNFEKTVVPSTPLSRNDTIYISNSNGDNSSVIDSLYSEPGYTNIELLTLAESLKGDSNIDTINNIKSYLHNNYVYSVDTNNRADMIDYFLFTQKEGFCVHFTRSFIKLARINGISVREVSGYNINIKRPENGQYRGFDYITGKNSHMWPEVYLNSKWITFEVTPGYDSVKYVESAIENTPEILKENSLTYSNDSHKLNFYLLYILLIPLVYIVMKIIKGNPVNEIIRKSKKMGVKHPEITGWIEWNLNAFGSMKHSKIFLDYAYKKRALSKDDKAYIRKLKKLLGNNIHNSA